MGYISSGILGAVYINSTILAGVTPVYGPGLRVCTKFLPVLFGGSEVDIRVYTKGNGIGKMLRLPVSAHRELVTSKNHLLVGLMLI